jgi:hypothetical protein
VQALEKVCGVIAADKSRREIAYTKIVDELFKRDPSGTMHDLPTALEHPDILRSQISDLDQDAVN